MKILIYNDLVYGGGAETLLRCFARYFYEKKHEVTIVASPANKDDFLKAFSPEIHCIRARLPRISYDHLCFHYIFNRLKYKAYRVFFRLKMCFKKFDVVIAFKSIYIKEVIPFHSKRKYAWVHSDYRGIHNEQWFKKIFPDTKKEFDYLSRFNKIVCVSETAREGIVKTVGDTGNLEICYNPIDVSSIQGFADKESEFVKDLSKFLLVSTGRLDSEKNYLTLLKACKLLSKMIPVDIWIIGDGPQRKELEKFIEENRLDNVSLLGFQTNPYPMMKQADLFISSSINETYGLAIQEALILGVPVIAVKCPGVEETFDYHFGKLTDNSAEDLSKEIYNVLTEKEVFLEYKRNIKEKYPLNQLYKERMKKICDLLEIIDA